MAPGRWVKAQAFGPVPNPAMGDRTRRHRLRSRETRVCQRIVSSRTRSCGRAPASNSSAAASSADCPAPMTATSRPLNAAKLRMSEVWTTSACRQRSQQRGDVGESRQACRDHDTVCIAAAAISQGENKTTGLPIQTLDVDILDPGHHVLLKPPAVSREVLHRAWFERLESARPIVIGKGIAGRRRRDVRSEAVRFQVSFAAGLGDVRPELHRTPKNAVLDIASRKMRGQRKTVGSRSDDCD